jgi:hypothetical protein
MEDLGFESQQRKGILLFSEKSSPVSWTTHLPIQWVPGYFLGVSDRGGRLIPSCAEVKNKWSYTSTLPIRFHGVDRDIFAFTQSVYIDFRCSAV